MSEPQMDRYEDILKLDADTIALLSREVIRLRERVRELETALEKNNDDPRGPRKGQAKKVSGLEQLLSVLACAERLRSRNG
jgi:hypothetical protein